MSKNKFNTDLWSTPQWLFDEWNTTYGPFDLDVCASAENVKCIRYYDEQFNGLNAPWHFEFPGENPPRCWMNPPYSDPYPSVKKASEESKKGCLVVALLNYDHTMAWWKEFIEDPANDYKPYPGVTIHKLPKRIKFDAPKWFIESGGKVTTNTRPSVIVVFNKSGREK